MKSINIIWGILLIFIGLILGINALGITKIGLLFTGWWAVLIIICYICKIINNPKTSNFIGLVIGIFLFLIARDIISFEIFCKLLIPVLIVIIGISILFKGRKDKVVNVQKVKSGKKLEYCSTFTVQTIDLSKNEVEYLCGDAIFGSLNLDLTKAKLEKECVIKATSIFGGMKIKLPKDVQVRVKSFSLFGGVTNECSKNNSEAKTVILIETTSLFGGVKIYE